MKGFYKGVVLGAAVSSVMLISSAALAGSGIGGVFNLGKTNTVNASTVLSGSANGSMLNVRNSSTGSNAAGIVVHTESGKAPLVVNSSTKVTHLNADLLDGHEASTFASKSSLSSPGFINEFSNPVDWSKLKNVPNGFADGTDNVGYLDGFQYSGSVAAGVSQTAFTFGYNASYYVAWYANPTATGGRIQITAVEEELVANGTITYHITVKNTGSVTTGYDVHWRMFTS